MCFEETPRLGLGGFGHAHFTFQQRIDQRIIRRERAALCVEPFARFDTQPLGLGQQQLPDRERLGRLGPCGGGIGRGVVLGFGGDGSAGDFDPANPHDAALDHFIHG